MRRVIAIAAGLISVFFTFYFIRLLLVTRLLRHIRAGGGGAYVGAIVFPLIALGCGLLAWRLWRRASVAPPPSA